MVIFDMFIVVNRNKIAFFVELEKSVFLVFYVVDEEDAV